MKKATIGVVSFIAGAVMMTGVSSFAAPVLKPISVYLNQSLKIKLNGEVQDQIKTPITYDGTTYLPLRDVADMFGAYSKFDNKTQTIEIVGGDVVVNKLQDSNSSDAQTGSNSNVSQSTDNTRLSDEEIAKLPKVIDATLSGEEVTP